MCIVTRVMTLVATAALAGSVLFPSSRDYRTPVCIIVCVAALMLALRSLLMSNAMWALLFLSVVGIFTPLRSEQFSHLFVSVFDLATLALFAVSPRILRACTDQVPSVGITGIN